MSPEELANLIEELILKADARYARQIIAVQNTLYDELVSTLKDLDLQDGYILQTAANRRILDEADLKISEVFAGQAYQNAVSSYVSVIGKVDEANQKYFSTIPKFKENKQFLKSLQGQTVETVEKYILQDGLQSQVISPLSQILNQNINSGGKFSGFLQQVRGYVVGTESVEGKALSYSRTFLRDTMFTYSRTYQHAVTNDLGLEFFLYSGGITDKSREFCIDRKGKFFHKKEVESWAHIEWKGKKQGTTESSIFLFAGGWNCADSLIAVHSSIVPPEDLQRAREEGYIK